MIEREKLLEECQPVLRENDLSSDYFQGRVRGVRDTLPKILADNFRENPAGLSMRKKDLGIWSGYTWAQVYEKVKSMALGLKSLGLERGDKVCVIGDNDPQWYWAELAVQSMGGVVVGLYIDAMPGDVEYLLTHSDSSFVFAKDQEQADKFLEVREKVPRVKRVVYWDRKGMAGYRKDPWLLELDDLIHLGQSYEFRHPKVFEEEVEAGGANDPAVLCYTSGTTSLPKGAMISHAYLIKGTIRWAAVNLPQAGDEYLSFVPPAWIAEQLLIASWLVFRTRVNFPEEPETVMENIREIGPQMVLLAPMQWQGLLSMVQMKIFDTGPVRKLLYRACLPVGYKIAEYRLKGRRSLPLLWRILYGLANGLCLYHIRDSLGLSKIRFGITGGSALGPDVFRWFLAIGVGIKDSYGLTEINPVTVHGRKIKPGTSGPPVPGVQVKVSEEGEIFLRSDVLFQGYYKNPEATGSMMVDGWVKTGDCGTLDEDGHLIIYDRMKDMLRLKGGGRYSPTYIENRLKFSPYIKDAMIIGGEEREFLFGIVIIDFDNVGKWAEKTRLSYTTFVDLSQKEEVYNLVEKDVLRVNATLPDHAKVRRFTLLHKEFDPDEGELTKTRKLRRGFLEKRYEELIQASFSGREKIVTEAEVKYRDGRQGKVKTDLKIRTVETGR